LYKVEITDRPGETGGTMEAFIAVWEPEVFENFMADDSVFVKRNAGQDADWDEILDDLQDFEEDALHAESILNESDALTGPEVSNLKSRGAALFFGVSDQGSLVTRGIGFPGPVTGGAMIGMGLEDIVDLLESTGYETNYLD
jgi:hypothetical protein